jgi:hypothetical protein
MIIKVRIETKPVAAQITGMKKKFKWILNALKTKRAVKKSNIVAKIDNV